MAASNKKQTTNPTKGRPTRTQRRAAERSQAKRPPPRKTFPLGQILGAVVTLIVLAGIMIYVVVRTTSAGTPTHRATGPAVTNPADLHPVSAMLKSGRPAPTFTLHGVNGHTYNLAAQRGHPVLLEFFAVWCPHCQHEAPIIQRLHNSYGPRGVQIWSILANPYGPNYDASFGQDTTPASRADVLYFSRTYGEHVPQLIDPHFHVVNEYGINGYPGIYVVDKHGMITYSQSGDQSYQALASALNKALSGT